MRVSIFDLNGYALGPFRGPIIVMKMLFRETSASLNHYFQDQPF